MARGAGQRITRRPGARFLALSIYEDVPMRTMNRHRVFPRGPSGPVYLILLGALWACEEMSTATRVTSPEEQFGHEIGADYVLPNYVELTEYWEVLASESDRMVLEVIGQTEEGRDQLMATITSPANHRNLGRYKEIAERLAHAEGVSEADARAMADEGRAVVWIDGGLHASEVLGAQQLMELVYQLVGGTDDETMRILDDVIVLVGHANPDGHDLLADWYMRVETPEERSTSGAPVLYNKYAGHDNNRDFYMSALEESTNINRILAAPSGSRRSSTTTTRPVRWGRSCSRRPSAIRPTTTWIRSS